MDWQDITVRLGLAMLFGFIIGLEREHNNRPAGMKTHILVCMGAALISLIQTEIAENSISRVLESPELGNVIKCDMGRLGAQVISGIGFLGAVIPHNLIRRYSAVLFIDSGNTTKYNDINRWYYHELISLYFFGKKRYL